MTYDNIKSHKKRGFHPFSEKHIFAKKHWGGGVNSTPAFLGLTLFGSFDTNKNILRTLFYFVDLAIILLVG